MNIVDSLQNGGVGVMATDTVYGVVGRLFSPEAVARIYKVKHRNPKKPVGTVLIASTDQLRGIVDSKLVALASQYWPGPTSVVLPVGEDLAYAHKGLGSLAFRVPADDQLVKLLEQTGPLATSSANLEGQSIAVNVYEAKDYFGSSVDFYEDSGDIPDVRPSRIIKITDTGSVQEIRS